jgi:hypothetical protein
MVDGSGGHTLIEHAAAPSFAAEESATKLTEISERSTFSSGRFSSAPKIQH